MKVAMICPYSMSRPGGVQGQVLGLARELRQLDVDVRIVAPCDGPPPDADDRERRARRSSGSRTARSRRSRPGARPRGARPRRCARSSPTSCTCTSRSCPGPTVSALIGFNGPMVGTFHAAGEVPYQWLRPALRSLMMRLTFRVAVSESARETAAGNWTGAEYTVLWNGIEIDRIASAAPAPSPTPTVLFIGRHEPRKGLEVLLDAWAGIDRDAAAAGGRRRAADRRAAAPRRSATSSGSARSPTRRATRCSAARPCSARRRCGASRSASCCSRRWPRARRSSRPRSRATRTSRAPGQRRAARAAGRRRRAAGRAPRLLDDPALRARLVASGRERAEQFSMRAPRRALPRALRTGAGAGGVTDGRPVTDSGRARP